MYMLYNITVDWYGATASQHRSDIGKSRKRCGILGG